MQDRLTLIKDDVPYDVKPDGEYYQEWYDVISSDKDNFRSSLNLESFSTKKYPLSYSYHYFTYIPAPQGKIMGAEISSPFEYSTREECFNAFKERYPWVKK